jgi:uncharacterized protein YecT (DUF1311 family)
MDNCAAAELADLQRQLSVALAGEARVFGNGLVHAAEEHWVAYRNAECTAVASTYRGGSIYPLIVGDCQVHLTVERITDIRQEVASQPH